MSRKKQATATPPAEQPKISKKDQLINLLRREGGASVDEMIAATGWLPHTTRAMLTGLRKKGFGIEKVKIDGATRYSINADPAA